MHHQTLCMPESMRSKNVLDLEQSLLCNIGALSIIFSSWIRIIAPYKKINYILKKKKKGQLYVKICVLSFVASIFLYKMWEAIKKRIRQHKWPQVPFQITICNWMKFLNFICFKISLFLFKTTSGELCILTQLVLLRKYKINEIQEI